ncbi:monosaccharide ABC transporter substrate-binding protein (CUT2 family) [Tamaricihabitans halophyticus]|uniref:Monosaccharide ABC transporter substrate-binding protein (CUT2 family) n=1 Tax=Tamaricihabitans halophyticus TaxID=1262583 RepID=A0A4R2QQQ0_9PSEU|nr:ABC transporter substrate-binding protein [Tamaricihabitans halophyticus]TCP49371.1 monosaccharide ABC transporter substrate-binding protein (CUT2 family) [Tamaricihabitans halophyticus]
MSPKEPTESAGRNSGKPDTSAPESSEAPVAAGGAVGRRRVLFSTSFVLAAVVLTMVVGLVIGRALGGPGGPERAGPSAFTGTEIDVIIKATDSSFWQSMLAGAQRAEQDLGITVGKFGPTTETDVDEQVRMVENSISRGVDAIVLAANSQTALDEVINRARDAGIKVITVDGKVATETEGFIGTDNLRAGEQAAERLCRLMRDAGHRDGKVFLANAVAGVQALQDRARGFRNGLAANCPSFQISQERFNNNDIPTAVGQLNDEISAVDDLVGVFAANNMSGNGVAQAVKENGLADELPVVAFDSDPQENAALAQGPIDALVVQKPYFFGYQGVVEAAKAVSGSQVEAELDPGAVLADRQNMRRPDIKVLLNPPTVTADEGGN